MNSIYNRYHAWDANSRENDRRVIVKCIKCGAMVSKFEEELCTYDPSQKSGNDYVIKGSEA